MEMNSVMATEIVATEVEHCAAANRQHQAGQPNVGAAAVLPAAALQRGSGVAFQSGIKWYINLGKTD